MYCFKHRFLTIIVMAVVMLALVLSFTFIGCKKTQTISESKEAKTYEDIEKNFKGELNGLFLAGYDEASALDPFLKKYGINLKATYFGTFDEAFNKIKTSAPGTFDIVSTTNGYMQPWVAAGILEPLNLDLIPNWTKMSKVFQEFSFGVEDTTVKYNIPFTFGSAVCNYNSNFMEPIESWTELLDPKYKGKIAMVDDWQGQIMNTARITGYSKENWLLTPDELEAAKKFLIELKANSKAIAPTWGDLISMFLAQDVWVTNEGWEYLSITGAEEGIPIFHNIPKEGAFSWCDGIAIVKDAPNLDTAYGLVNQIISKEGQAAFGNTLGTGLVNQEALPDVDEKLVNLFPYDKIDEFLTKVAPIYQIPPKESGEFATQDDWIKTWEEVKLK